MKKLFTCLLLVYPITPISAQTIDIFDMTQGTHDNMIPASPYLLTGRLQDNIFAGVAFGSGFYFGDGDGDGSNGGRAGLAWEISVGKWATPALGLRLQFSSMKARGHSAGNTIYSYGTPDASGYYEKRFGIENYRGDVLLNIRNLIEGYGDNRLWNCIPFVGAGIGHSHANGHSRNEFNLDVGVFNTLRITGRIDGTAEIRYMAVNSRFDGITGKGLDGALSLTFGLQFNFGRKGFKRPVQLLGRP